MNNYDESFDRIVDEIKAEQEYARDKWGIDVDRNKNLPNDWTSYIAHYSHSWMQGEFTPYTRKCVEDFRDHMIKVANLAITAAQEMDLILDGTNSRPDILKADNNETKS